MNALDITVTLNVAKYRAGDETHRSVAERIAWT